MNIPIANLYYILSYAWGYLPQGEVRPVSSEASVFPPDLFAELLAIHLERLNKKGLQKDYVEVTEEGRRLKGKMLVGKTISKALLQTGKVVCSFDEYTVNTLPNRIIKTTALRILSDRRVDKELTSRLHQALFKWHSVEPIELDSRLFYSSTVQRQNRDYGFLMHLCEFVFNTTLPDTSPGKNRFIEFIRDERIMCRVFEEFVRNFFRYEKSEFHPKAESLEWSGKAVTEGAGNYLPILRTDISMTTPDRRLVIEVKYYQDGAVTSHFEKESLHSRNLYQLLSYLKNIQAREGVNPEGTLLYAGTTKRLPSLYYELLGHKVCVRSLDLTQSWKAIREDLLSLVA